MVRSQLVAIVPKTSDPRPPGTSIITEKKFPSLDINIINGSVPPANHSAWHFSSPLLLPERPFQQMTTLFPCSTSVQPAPLSTDRLHGMALLCTSVVCGIWRVNKKERNKILNSVIRDDNLTDHHFFLFNILLLLLLVRPSVLCLSLVLTDISTLCP